jgi:hypothetical protein
VRWAGKGVDAGAARAGASARWGREADRFPWALQGLTYAPMVRASSRPSQARGRRRGRGRGSCGSSTGIGGRRRRPACHPPPTEGRGGSLGWHPRPPGCRAFPAAACSPPDAPPPRPRRAGTSEPRPPGTSRPRSERPFRSLMRRQRRQKAREGAGGAQEPALPAAAAASRNSSRWIPCAPQRSAAAGGSGSFPFFASAHGLGAIASRASSYPHASLLGTAAGDPFQQGPWD